MTRITLEAIFEELVQDIMDSYVDNPTDSPEAILEQSCVDATDFCHLMNSLRTCPTYSVHVTIKSEDMPYEHMCSRFVVFNGDATPIYGIFFDEVIGTRNGSYQGLRIDGVKKVIQAIVDHENRLTQVA